MNGRTNIVKALLADPDIAVNARDYDGNSALMLAANNRNIEIVQALLARKDIEVNAINIEGDSALMLATIKGDIKIVQVLLAKPDIEVNTKNNNGFSAIMLASIRGDIEIVQALLAREDIEVNARDKNGFSALMLAAKFGHINIIQALLAKPGIDVIDDENAILNIIKEKNLGDDIIELIIHEIWRAENPNIIGDPGGPGFQALKAKYNLDPTFKEANEKEKQKYIYIPSPEYIEKTKYIKKSGSRGRKYKRIKKSRKYKRTKKSKKSRRTRIRTKLIKAKPC